MRLPTLLFVAAVSTVATSFPTPSHATAVSSEHVNHCATLGFDVDALDCRRCGDLSTFLTSTTPSKMHAVKKLGQECQKCCSDFSNVVKAEGRRYPKAVLAVSPYRLKWYPKVASFVEHQAPQIQGLTVQESTLRLPMLQFFDHDEALVEEISVASWDENSIAEFIDHKVLPEMLEEETDESEGADHGDVDGKTEL